MASIPDEMHLGHRQEAFSKAFVSAVVAAAGYALQSGPAPDIDSIDFTVVARGGGHPRSPKLDVQLKCERNTPDPHQDWHYDLKLKNYEELRGGDFMVPRVLVLVRVPPNVESWIHAGDSELVLRHCARWVSLRDCPGTSNATSVRILLKAQQPFSVEGLSQLMERLSQGGLP